jgi:hypothetical protein
MLLHEAKRNQIISKEIKQKGKGKTGEIST